MNHHREKNTRNLPNSKHVLLYRSSADDIKTVLGSRDIMPVEATGVALEDSESNSPKEAEGRAEGDQSMNTIDFDLFEKVITPILQSEGSEVPRTTAELRFTELTPKERRQYIESAIREL